MPISITINIAIPVPLSRFRQAPWTSAAGGDWMLFKCLSRLGVPLTPGGGFHQVTRCPPPKALSFGQDTFPFLPYICSPLLAALP